MRLEHSFPAKVGYGSISWRSRSDDVVVMLIGRDNVLHKKGRST